MNLLSIASNILFQIIQHHKSLECNIFYPEEASGELVGRYCVLPVQSPFHRTTYIYVYRQIDRYTQYIYYIYIYILNRVVNNQLLFFHICTYICIYVYIYIIIYIYFFCFKQTQARTIVNQYCQQYVWWFKETKRTMK